MTDQPSSKTRAIALALKSQLGPGLRAWLPFFACGLLVLAGMAAIKHHEQKDWAELTRDPVSVMRAAVTTGILSTIGGLAWAGAAAVCFFAAWATRKAGTSPTSAFFFWSGAFTFWLMCDDVFLFHEHVFPYKLHIPEKYAQGAYPVFCLLWLIAFAKTILRTRWLVLFLALSFLALSEFMDLVLHSDADVSFLIEDGFKFLGIVSWLAYFFTTAASALRREQLR